MAEKILFAGDSGTGCRHINELLAEDAIVTAVVGRELAQNLDQDPDVRYLMLDIDTLRKDDSILPFLLELAENVRSGSEKDILFDAIFNQAPIGISISFSSAPRESGAERKVNINPMFEQITGWSKEELVKLGWASITHPEDVDADVEQYRRLQAGDIKDYSMEKRFIKPDGSAVWVNMVVAALNIFHDDKYDHLCLIQDITKRKEIEKALIDSENSKSVLLANLQGLAYRCLYDREWTMLYVSEGCLELTGYSVECLLNNKEVSYNKLIAPEYKESLWNEWARVLAQRLPFRYEYEILSASGERKWVLEMGEGIYNEKGDVEALEGIIIDISKQKRVAEALKYSNEHDSLTGLYNRAYLERILEADAGKETKDTRVVIGINLRDVQALSSDFGFHYTQELLKKVSKGLAELCAGHCALYHTYEHRFAYYTQCCKGKDQIIEFCQRLVAKLEELLADERVGGGIGILVIEPDNELDANQLLKHVLIATEIALEDAQGGFKYCFFDEEVKARIAREESIKNDLERVISGEDDAGLFLQFQPILDLRTDEICGFEALARLNSQEYGLIPPLEFIPLAERAKLMVPLGREIIRKALGFLGQLEQHGFDSIYVSINISEVQLYKESFCEDLYRIIDEMNINPRNIALEVTESVFADEYIEINSLIGELRDYGIRIFIDDFGTGYSSLARQQEMSADYLKIDKYFVDKLANAMPENSLIGEIISISKKLGHESIAEGVELERQKQYLLDFGCNMIQGYLVSRPLGEQAAIKYLLREQQVREVWRNQLKNAGSCNE